MEAVRVDLMCIFVHNPGADFSERLLPCRVDDCFAVATNKFNITFLFFSYFLATTVKCNYFQSLC